MRTGRPLSSKIADNTARTEVYLTGIHHGTPTLGGMYTGRLPTYGTHREAYRRGRVPCIYTREAYSTLRRGLPGS